MPTTYTNRTEPSTAFTDRKPVGIYTAITWENLPANLNWNDLENLTWVLLEGTVYTNRTEPVTSYTDRTSP